MIAGMERVALIASLISCIVWQSVSANLLVIPHETESKVNDSTYFNCSTDILSKEIHWSHGNLVVYAGGLFFEPYLGRFRIEINNSTGAYNLVIPSVKPQDVGEYSCQDDGGHGRQSPAAKFIVLADEPTCHSNFIKDGNSCGLNPDEVQLSCSIAYYGKIPPKLEWRKAGENSLIEKATSVESGNITTYSITLKTDLSMVSQSYVCQTTQSVTSQYKCNSETIRLQYVFSGNATVNLAIDEEVNCSANSSQSCSYKWKWFNGSDSLTVSTDQTLRPTKVGSHRCEATCPIGNTSCVVDVMFAEVYSTASPEATSAGQMLWLLLLIPVMLLITIIIVVVLCRRHKGANKRPSTSQEVQTKKTDESTTPLIALKGKDKEEEKQNHTEPDEGPKEEVGAIKSDQAKAPLTASTEEDKEEVKQNDADPNKGPKEEVETKKPDESLIALKGKDKEEEKQSHTEPDQGLKEEVGAIKSDQAKAPLTASTVEDKEEVKQNDADPNKGPKEEVKTKKTDESTTPVIAFKGKDKEKEKQSHAEPDQGPKEEVGAIKSDQPLTASTVEDKEEVNENDADTNKNPKGFSFLEGKPETVLTIKLEGKITGVTVFKDNLVIATENSPVIDVYDVKTFQFIRRMSIKELVNMFDIACYHLSDYVFISGSKLQTKVIVRSLILRKDPTLTDKIWSTGDDFGNLSVSSESNVLLCVSDKNKLIEYTQNGGEIRVITLHDLVHPRHAIKLPSGEFLVSHGFKDDTLHRVCNVNNNGEVVRPFDAEKGTSLQQLKDPNYLIVDEDGYVLVSDSCINRVLLLDSGLKPKREFVTKRAVLIDPSKMCLCKATRNLFVVHSVNEVLIFNIK